MYIVDKKALKDYNYSISNDNIVLMKNGPVLYNTYNLIKHTGENADIQGLNEWNKYFINRLNKKSSHKGATKIIHN